MGKKKKVEPKDSEIDDDDLDELDDGLYGDEEELELYPKIEDKAKEKEEELDIEAEEEDYEEDFEDFEEEVETLDYTYVGLELNKGENKNDYELIVKGQSHGFCNVFIKHLLEVEGVQMAAYKKTSLDPSVVFIRLTNGYNIKEILLKGIESLREEVLEIQKVFMKLI